MTLDAVSRRLGDIGRPIDVSALAKLEKGQRRIDVDDLVALAEVLGVSAAWLVAGEPDAGTADTVSFTELVSSSMPGGIARTAEDIVRNLRRADDLAADGKTSEQIAADLGVSAAMLYNWRRQFGGMDTDAAKKFEALWEQNVRLKLLLADAELEKDALREIAKGRL